MKDNLATLAYAWAAWSNVIDDIETKINETSTSEMHSMKIICYEKMYFHAQNEARKILLKIREEV